MTRLSFPRDRKEKTSDKFTARFDLHVWSNIGDNKTFSLATRLREGNNEGKVRFYVKHIIDCLLSNQG